MSKSSNDAVRFIGHSNIQVNPLPPRAYLEECFTYDPETGVLTWRTRPVNHFRHGGKWTPEASANRWNSLHAGKQAGYLDKNGRRSVGLNYDGIKYDFMATRVIFALLGIEVPQGFVIDHINRDCGDDRRCNLRAISQGENIPRDRLRSRSPRPQKHNLFASPHLGRFPSKEYLEQCFSYNAESGDLVWMARPREHFKSEKAWTRFNSMRQGKIAGARIFSKAKERWVGIIVCMPSFKESGKFHFQAHNIIWIMLGRTIPDGMKIDHINGDSCDNRLSNLRIATHHENCCNTKTRRDKKDGLPKGVSKKGSWFSARIMKDGVSHWVGTFLSVEDAVQARKEHAQRLHGDFSSHLSRE